VSGGNSEDARAILRVVGRPDGKGNNVVPLLVIRKTPMEREDA
jgi:hypothetical protein